MWDLFFGKKYKKQIVFISSPIIANEIGLDTLDYFALITSEFIIRLRKSLPDYDVIVKVPEGGVYANENQKTLILETTNFLRKNKFEYSAVIISPYNKTFIRKEIKDLCALTKVFLIDQGYYTEAECDFFKGSEVQRPPFVQSNWQEGGEIAGKIMVEHFKQIKHPYPKILLVDGLMGSSERIDGFKRAFDASPFNKNIFFSEIKGEYNKEKTKIEFEQTIMELAKSHSWYDGIFATNDLMALTIREVLIKFKENLDGHISKIIGFDGIRDVTFLIDNDDDYFLDTIDVQIIKQIKDLVNIIERSIKEEPLESLNLYIRHSPVSYRKNSKK